MNNLKELAQAVIGWSNCNQAWTAGYDRVAVVGSIDEDGNKYPVTTIDCGQYYEAADSIKLARYYAAANPQAVLDLIEERDRLQAELAEEKNWSEYYRNQATEARADERQAMAYLSQIREIVGGDDFPQMIERIREMQFYKDDAQRRNSPDAQRSGEMTC